MNKRSISNLLFKRNITAVLLCLAFSAIILCVLNINSSHKQHTESAKNLLSTQKTAFDTSFDFVTGTIYQISQEQIFHNYMSGQKDITFDMLQLQKALSTRLSAIESSCYSAAIIRDSSTFVIASRESGKLDRYLKSIYVSKESYTNFYKSSYFSQSGVYYFIDSIEPDSPYITVGTKLSYKGYNSICVLLTFYKEYFYSSFSEYERFLMISDGKVVLDSNFNQNQNQVSNALVLIEELNKAHSNTATVKDGWTTYITIPSNAVDCRYILILGEPLTLILINIIFVIAAVFVIIFLFATIRNTMYMTKPIDRTAEKLRPFTGDSTNTDDIALISSAADNIIKENITLTSKLDSRINTLRAYFITDILSGVLLDDEILSGIEEYSISFAEGDITCTMLDFTDYDSTGSIGLDDLKETVNAILSRLDLCKTLGEIIHFKSKYILLFSTGDRTAVTEIIDELINVLEKEYYLKLTAAIGTVAHTPFEWKDSFNIALKLLENKYTLSYNKVLTPDNLAQINSKALYYPLDIEQLLINNTISVERTKVQLLICDILEKNLNSGKGESELILELAQSMVHTVNRCMQRINADISDVFEEGTIIYLELKMCRTKDELKNKLLELFDTIMNNISANSMQGSRLTAESFTKYIAQNYHMDISLTDVADFYGLSVPYTSKTIKQVTGQTFKEYLNFYRVQMAKKLFLEDDEILIGDAAQKVGFVNVNSFIRVFKSIEGTSPGSFRKNSGE